MLNLNPFAFLMSAVHGVIINWLGHIYGYVNVKMKNTSKNLFRFDFLLMGKRYHNKYASRANFGMKCYEIDITYLIIRLLETFAVIKLKPVPLGAKD